MTIKEIEDVFRRGDVTEDFLNTCKCDARKTVQAILRRYERTQQERARLYAMYAYHVELIDAETIDRMNILEATRKGMYDAVAALLPTPQEVLIDAVALPHLRLASESIV